MPTVKFGTGQSVNFTHNPTPQDIDEVATKLGVNKPPQNKGGFDNFLDKNSQAVNKVGNVLGDIAKTAIRGPETFAIRSGQLAGLGIAKAFPGTFDQQKAYETLDSPMKTPFGNTLRPISEETPGTVTGQAAGTLSFGIPNPTIAGALGGGGYALQEKKSPLATAGYTALGASLGYLGGKISAKIADKLNPSQVMQRGFSDTAATYNPSGVADTLQGIGVTDISNPHTQAIANNVLNNEISAAQQLLNQSTPDTISGQFAPETAKLQSHLTRLLDAQKALRALQSVPAIQNAPGILSKAATYGGKVLPWAISGLLGGAGLMSYLTQGNTPHNIIRKSTSGGTL